ncbi:MAG: aminopeptidase P family protein [Gemmatimonadota bacterium]|nr:MAG: aminopeptidase P family protein [Gemmatimonadota bacterium]
MAISGPGEPIRLAPATVTSSRRARLAAEVGDAVLLIPSAATKSIEGDYPQDSDFRQDNHFLYLTGLEVPDSWLVMIAAGGELKAEILFVPERNPAEEMWTGPRPSFREASSSTGIADVRAVSEFEDTAIESLKQDAGVKAIYAPLNIRRRHDRHILTLLFEGRAEVLDLEPALARLRLVKDEFEIEMLRRAIAITDAAHVAAMRSARPGMYEYELEAVIEYNFRRGGAERVGFPSIVGSGPNSVVLHYDKSRRVMEEGELVVMDVGAEYSYYSADVTRTIPVSGSFTERQREIYELVLGAQEAALEAVRPGNTLMDVERAARVHFQQHGGGICGPSGCNEHFPHGVSHWLGMDVHDVGDYSVKLEPGMVLTVEPGIYLAEEGIGVRIEDDVLVTPSGHERLSDAPREPDAIEALMAEGRGVSR